MKPLCIDLFCGLGGWTEGFLAEGYRVVGFDNHRHSYWAPEYMPEGDGGKGTYPVAKRGWTQGCAITLGLEGVTQRPRTRLVEYPGELVIQDVLTIHGSQFKDAAVIVASPPCQNYSYLAMPWSRSTNPDNSKAAKALRKEWETNGPDNRLFDACFRIQREAIEATKEDCHHCRRSGVFPNGNKCYCCNGTGRRGGRYIPLIVENVRGAIPWVGRSAWNYGSFHLWGDVPALMPIGGKRKGLGSGATMADGTGSTSWFFSNRADPRDARRGADGGWVNPRGEPMFEDGTKIGGDWFSDPKSTCRKHGSRSAARKLASAQIAKIPLPLAQHIAQVYYPRTLAQGGRQDAAAGKTKCL